MKLVENTRMVVHVVVGVLIVVVFMTPLCASGAVFFLDPDVSGGTHVGTQADPFNTLDASAWARINDALATEDVTVYCSARNTGSETNQLWNKQVDVTQKTPNPTGTLTFDGKSFWNSNDTTPSWSAYSGAARCQMFGFVSENTAHTKYSKVVIDGFVVTQDSSTGTSAILICGDNWTIQNSDISAKAGATVGPLIYWLSTSDGLHQGTDGYCNPMSGLVIQDNVLHDSRGELLYLGGAGCRDSATDADRFTLRTDNGACGGVPSNSNVTIQRNRIFNCGSRGPQGDCIDVKAAVVNLTIRENDISGNRNDNDSRCIVMQGITMDGTNQNFLIERNRIHDCLGVDDAAVAIVQDWGTPNGIVVRNNVIANVTGRAGECIRVEDTQAAGVQIYNNTIYGCQSFGIVVYAGTVTAQNNAILNSNAGRTQTAMSGTITSDHNAFSGTWGGTCTTCVSDLTSAAFTNVGTQNFALPPASVLIDKGTTIASFSNDHLNILRPQGPAWDVGAYEFSIGAQIPSPPRNLRSN